MGVDKTKLCMTKGLLIRTPAKTIPSVVDMPSIVCKSTNS